jgi:uncharacterized protein (TIGR02246 family)
MKKQILAIAIATSAMFAACNSAPEDAVIVEVETEKMSMDDLRATIQSMEDAYAAGEAAKDAAAVVEYYSDDAVSYGRNAEPLVGKEAIKAKLAERLAGKEDNMQSVYKIVDLFADGDNAVEIGSWEVFDAAGELKDKGHYMSYFEKRDGKYLCVRDMNVSSMPEKKE